VLLTLNVSRVDPLLNGQPVNVLSYMLTKIQLMQIAERQSNVIKSRSKTRPAIYMQTGDRLLVAYLLVTSSGVRNGKLLIG